MDAQILALIMNTLGISEEEIRATFNAYDQYVKRAIDARFETSPVAHQEILSEAIDPLSYKQCVLFGVRIAMDFDGVKTPVEEGP